MCKPISKHYLEDIDFSFSTREVVYPKNDMSNLCPSLAVHRVSNRPFYCECGDFICRRKFSECLAPVEVFFKGDPDLF